MPFGAAAPDRAGNDVARCQFGAGLVRQEAFTGLVDQGSADEYLEEQLKPTALVEAARRSGQKLELRMQPGYDHDWYFISTFMAEHLRFHASRLGA